MSYSNLLKIPGFRAFWIGQTISLIGDSFYYLVFMFMVGKLTGSAAMVGFVGALETIPFLVLSPYAGVLADRLDRRKILLATALCSGTVLMLFLVPVLAFDEPPLWTLFVTAFVTSIVTSFFSPAKNAALPSLVPPEQMLSANALNSISSNLTPMFAHVMTATVLGVLFGLSPKYFFASVVLLNALSFFVSAWFFVKMPSSKPERVDEQHPWEDLKEGLRYLRGRLDLSVLVFVQALLSLFMSPFFVVYIATNKAWFGDRPSFLAICEATFFLGMVIGSVVVGKHNVRKAGVSFAISLFFVGITVVLMGYSRDVWLFSGLNFLAGLAVPYAQIPVTTYLQLTVPDAFRGRVNSTLGMVQMGVMPIGLALGGVMIERIGLINAFLLMGGGMGGAALLGLAFKVFREAVIPDLELSSPVQLDPAT